MRISFLTDYLPINGSIRRTVEIANELVRRGHKAIIYSLDTRCSWLQCDAEIKPQKQVIGDTHDALIFNKADKSQWRLMEQAQAGKKLFYLAGMGDELSGKETLKKQLAGDTKARGRTYIFKQCLEKYTVICNGTWMRDFLVSELGYDNVRPVLNGVNTNMFYPVYNHEENMLYHIKFNTTTKGVVDAWERDIKKFRGKTMEIWGDKFIDIVSIEISSQEDMQAWWEKEYGGSIY